MEDIRLTKKQEEGLRIAIQRFKNHERYTCISGFAGSGKSTLVQYIIKELNIPENQIAYIAYTGKAACVLKSKGCPGATTAHKLLYNTIELPDGTFQHTPKDKPDHPLKLIAVDEISMLEKEMWEILQRWRVYVICLGDPFQLPPIHEDNGILAHPHIFLDEIMRQAQDNEIIRLSMDIREGRPLKYFKGKDVRIVPKESITDKLLVTADMVLCGKNATRYFLNRRMRKAVWGEKYVDEPINGDKCICLKNYWNYGDLTNGTIGKISSIKKEDSLFLKPKFVADFDTDSGDWFPQLSMDYKIFTEGKTTVNQDNWMMYPKEIRPMEFDYAYTITSWKGQGSEWDKVVVFTDRMSCDKEMYLRYLYTSVTRAKAKLVVAI